MCRQVQRVLRFQSTLPVRGATKTVGSTIAFDVISIHAPRAGSDINPDGIHIYNVRFQSTLPVRGATRHQFIMVCIALFQSTLPVRGATSTDDPDVRSHCISIHAPRAGSDARYTS